MCARTFFPKHTLLRRDYTSSAVSLNCGGSDPAVVGSVILPGAGVEAESAALQKKKKGERAGRNELASSHRMDRKVPVH